MNEERKTAIENFLNAMITDETLAGQVAALAVQAGYDFTAEDLLALGEAQPLSDDETAEAAGGVQIASFPTEPPQIISKRRDQIKLEDLIYRMDSNPPAISVLPCRPDDKRSAKRSVTFL